MMKWILLGTILMTQSLPGFTKSYDTNCFAEHIRESIVINTARKPVYAALTNGASDRVFKQLILSEQLTIPVAMFYDLRARKYQQKNVPLFCHEFMSMTATPDFDPERRVIPAEKFEPYDFQNLKRDLNAAVTRKDVDAIKRLSLEAIHVLEKAPAFHCMLRHIIESIYRFAYFIPLQAERAEKAGLKSPAGISFEVIRLQILSLSFSAEIDVWSAPIQAKGIPILCAELPRLMDDLD
jgi:hypothetical protein